MRAWLVPIGPFATATLIPDFHPQVYFEFIHRVVAGADHYRNGLMLQAILMTQRKEVPGRLKALAGLSLLMLAGQIVLGGLTVLLQLKAGVVGFASGDGERRSLNITLDFAQIRQTVRNDAGPIRVNAELALHVRVGRDSFSWLSMDKCCLEALVTSNQAALGLHGVPEMPRCLVSGLGRPCWSCT